MPSAWAGCLLEIWEETRQQTPRGLARHDGRLERGFLQGAVETCWGGAGFPGRKSQLYRWTCSINHTPGLAWSSPSEGIL